MIYTIGRTDDAQPGEVLEVIVRAVHEAEAIEIAVDSTEETTINYVNAEILSTSEGEGKSAILRTTYNYMSAPLFN